MKAKDPLLSFYNKNLDKLGDAWYDRCFISTVIPKIEDRISTYHNSNQFWSFVTTCFEKKLIKQ